MAVVNFPDNPSDGDTQDVGGITYTYSSSKGYWTAAASGGGGGGGASVTTDDAAPSSPNDGDLWWDSDGGKMYVYYADADSSQWVSVSVPGPTGAQGATGAAGADGADGADATPTSYINFAAFPSTGNTLGDFAVAQDTKALYMWDGTEWDRVYSGPNEDVTWTTEPPTTLSLASDGSTSSFTVAATDPEGFDITYSYDTSPSNQTQATIVQSGGTFTFTPSTNSANAGSFTFRSKASDGLNVSAKTSTISLEFFNGSYLIAGDGTQIIGTGGTTVVNADTVSDSLLQNSAGRIDNTGELILFTGMPAFSFNPTSSDAILVYAVMYTGGTGGASIGISAVDDSSRSLQNIASGTIGWGFDPLYGGFEGSSSGLTTNKWYIIGVELATGSGAAFDARIYNVTDNTWINESTSGSSGYLQPYLPINGTYDNHIAFYGGSPPSPITGYTARTTMSHKVAAVAVMNNNTSIDTNITQFKDYVFT